MRDLSFKSFSARLGEVFPVTPAGLSGAAGDSPAQEIALTLEKLDQLGTGEREGGSFSLIFSGPAAEPLPQATHAMRIGDDVHPIFLVPVARKGDLLQYQAIFN